MIWQGDAEVLSVAFHGIDEAAQAVAALGEVILQVSVHLKHAKAPANAAQLGDIDGRLLDVDGLLMQQLPLCTQEGPSSHLMLRPLARV